MQFSSDLQDQLTKIREEGEEREAERRARTLGVPYLNLGHAPVQMDALKMIPEVRARILGVALFEAKKQVAALAAWDPKANAVQAFVHELERQGFSVKLFVVSRRGLERVWSFYEYVPKAQERLTGRVHIEESEVERLRKDLVGIATVGKAVSGFDFESASVTPFLELVFAGAIANRASDIHFEAEERSIKLRYRIDGILHDISTKIPTAFYIKAVSRVKLLSNLKINVTDRPQDGRFTIVLASKEIEIRAAVAPSEFGEIIVLRILDPSAIRIALKELGLREDDLAIIKDELEKPNGMILNTGPTGSGKTTTLYAFLISKYKPDIKIITIEDPIEYHLEGIEQTQVHEESHYTFANGLRSIMRQDPDVILVGEIRDTDTAEIALQAALTGHLVFSTIHANDAAGAIPRILDLGVRPSSIGPALNLIIAQRLVRILCNACRIARTIPAAERRRYEEFLKRLPERAPRIAPDAIKIFEPKGCAQCSELGYKGRIAIFELFRVGEEFESRVIQGVGEAQMRKEARAQGMVTMQEDGILKVLQGMTSFAEVEETTGKIEWN